VLIALLGEADMEENAFRAAMVCKLLGNTTRYRIMKLLADGKMTPGQLGRELGKSATVISNQLAKLRAAGLVRFKRERDGLMYWPKMRGVSLLIRRLETFAGQSG
jgi:ArsR family transcriptional regulator, virulence genes transcriptional regulator